MPEQISRRPRTPIGPPRKSRGVPPAHPVKRPDTSTSLLADALEADEVGVPSRILPLVKTPMEPRAFTGPMSPVGGKRVD